MKINMERFHDAFFEEAIEHLSTLETELLRLEKSPGDAELLDNIFRAAHSIKGSSGTFGFPKIAAFTHHLESLLDRVRAGSITPDRGLVDLLLRATDILCALVDGARDGGDEKVATNAVTLELEAALGIEQGNSELSDSPASASVSMGSKNYRIRFVPPANIFMFGMDPTMLLSELAELGEVLEIDCIRDSLPRLEELDCELCHLGWTLRLQTECSRQEIADVFMFIEDESDISIEEDSSSYEPEAIGPINSSEGDPPRESRSRSNQTESIRVPVEKVEELINLVGELVIANSMINQSINQLPVQSVPFLQEAADTMQRTTHDLQERVMAVRMMPVGHVFRRFPRLVRDLASSLGKHAEVEIFGEDTELDKQVIEEIGDPLTHLVRNAIDHGIETPEKRAAAGKPTGGKIRLNAFHEGGNVIIEISDDGAGLDHARILEKAISKGIIGADAELTNEQIAGLIFQAGFSTAETVSDVSGRGVGMDVVKRNVELLNGSISIQSQLGVGTTFRIKLPLTMAILDGLSLALDNEIYVVPLLSVVESIRPEANEVQTVIGQGEVVRVRGDTIPLIRLHQIFHCNAKTNDPTEALVVILEHQGRKFGLMVDELRGTLQVVMKSLEDNYEKVEGISGATILGDGHVAFILDIPGLLRLAGCI